MFKPSQTESRLWTLLKERDDEVKRLTNLATAKDLTVYTALQTEVSTIDPESPDVYHTSEEVEYDQYVKLMQEAGMPVRDIEEFEGTV